MQFIASIKTPTCFGTEMPSSGIYSAVTPLRSIRRTSHAPCGRDPFGSHKNETDVFVHTVYRTTTTADVYLGLLTII
jgi:hypothetical protein